MEKSQIAYLSNKGSYTYFSFGDRTIYFLTSKNLEKYISVKEWDDGYIVVESKNFGKPAEEDYIDLIPILKNLLIDADEFLKPIKKVEVRDA